MTRAELSWPAEVARVVTAQVLLHSAFAGMRLAAPLLALDQGLSKPIVGLVVGMFALGQIVFVLPVGLLAERRGFHATLWWSLGSGVAAAALAIAWPIVPVLCVAGLLCGGAVGGTSVAIQQHVARGAASDDVFRRALVWISIAPTAANLIGPLAVGLLIDLAGHRAAFVFLGILPVLAWLSGRRARRFPPAAPTSKRKDSVWGLWLDPTFRQIAGANWLVSLAWEVNVFMVPVLGHDRGFSASAIGGIHGAFSAAATAARFSMVRIVRVVPEWTLVRGALASAAGCLALMPFLHVVPAMLAVATALGASLGIVQPVMLNLLYHTMPPHRQTQALSMRIITVSATGVASPLLYGAAGAVLGASGVFWLVAAVVACGAGFVLSAVPPGADPSRGDPH